RRKSGPTPRSSPTRSSARRRKLATISFLSISHPPARRARPMSARGWRHRAGSPKVMRSASFPRAASRPASGRSGGRRSTCPGRAAFAAELRKRPSGLAAPGDVKRDPADLHLRTARIKGVKGADSLSDGENEEAREAEQYFAVEARRIGFGDTARIVGEKCLL